MEPNELKEWSVFVYICADMPDLRLIDAAIADVSSMRKAGSSDDVGLVAQVDLPQLPTKRYVFPKKGTVDDDQFTLYELDHNVNTADPRSIVQFFEWANQKAPAKNVFLILWGHGYGIDDFDPFLSRAMSSDTKGHADGLALFSGLPDNNGPFPLIQAPIRDMSQAAIPGLSQKAALKNSDIGRAVKQCGEILDQGNGQKLAILGFDSCDMSMLEVWSEMQDGPEIGIGSQFGVPFKGWPYTAMLEALNANPKVSPRELAASVVDLFAKYNDGQKKKPIVTLSACELGAFKEIALPLSQLAAALAEVSASRELRAKIFDARNQSPIFYEDGFIDVGGFCRHLQDRFPDGKIHEFAGGVREAIPKYVLKTSYAPIGTLKKISESTGVSLWFPPWIQYPDIEILQKKESKAYFHDGYGDTTLAKATHWHACLKAIYQNSLYDAQF